MPRLAGSDLTGHQHLSAVALATVPRWAPRAPTVICRAHGAAGRETGKGTRPLACMCALGLCFLFDGRLEVFTLSQNKGNCDFCFPFAYLIPCTFDSGITLLTGMISPQGKRNGSFSLSRISLSPDVTLAGTSGTDPAQRVASVWKTAPQSPVRRFP